MAVNGNVKKTKASVGTRFVKFFKELKSEFKRITWASKKDVKKATIAVITFCVIFIAIITVLDFGFNHLYKLIFK